MLTKTKYFIFILSANIFLCSAEDGCKLLELLTGSSKEAPQELTDKNGTLIDINQIIKNKDIEKITNEETSQQPEEKRKLVFPLKTLLTLGINQNETSNDNEKEGKDEYKTKNLGLIEHFLKEMVRTTNFPKILKSIINTKALVDFYELDETFQKLSNTEQMKLALMFWCLQSEINFDFQNETIEDFTKKITYSNIKNILNNKIDELINEEKLNANKKEEKEIDNENKESKIWEKYKDFKIADNESIKPLFYYFIKNCILTSTAILVDKYCNLCKDKFGEVFISANKDKTKDYIYSTKNGIFNRSDDNDTIVQTDNLFSSNPKYTRICRLSFEDLTKLIGLVTKLPNFNEFTNSSNKDEGKAKKLDSNAFKKYKDLLDFVKQKKDEINEVKKYKLDSVHFYDIDKFFNIGITINYSNNAQATNGVPEGLEDLEFLLPETFGDLVSKTQNGINNNVQDITFNFKPSKYKIINLTFEKCKFTNPNVDLEYLVSNENANETNREEANYSDDEDEDDY